MTRSPSPETVTHLALPSRGSDFEFEEIPFTDAEIRALEAQALRQTFSRRGAIPDFDQNSDEFQIKVVKDRSPFIRVVAPAGAGKTQTLVNRMMSLMIDDGVPPTRLLLLTFDRNAAESVQAKAREVLSGGIELKNQIRTLNSFGYRLLKLHFAQEHKPLIKFADAHRLLRATLRSLQERSPERNNALPRQLGTGVYLGLFSILKNHLFDPRATSSREFVSFVVQTQQGRAFLPTEVLGVQKEKEKRLALEALLWLFRTYDAEVARSKTMDFDDQKLRAWACLSRDIAALEAVQSSLHEVIVDEFQDINRLDFELIRLVSDQARLVVSGDDDQAIYAFRGSNPDYLINLQKYFVDRKLTRHELSKNYRCAANIVMHADRLIRHNTIRIPKNPIAVRSADATIKVGDYLTAPKEAELIVATIQKIRSENKVRYSDFAILYRANAQSLPLQVEMVLNDIPYTVRAEDDISKNRSLSDLLEMLELREALRNNKPVLPDLATSSVRVFVARLDDAQLREVKATFSGPHDYHTALSSSRMDTVVPRLAQRSFGLRMREFVQAPNLLAAMQVLSTSFDGLKGMVATLEDAMDGRKPLAEIFELASAYKNNAPAFIGRLSQALERARKRKAGEMLDGVALRTYFGSKGLQWHTVFLVSCNDGLIPDSRSPVEDERRLFYVGLTRAQENLLISYLHRSCGSRVGVSPFLVEAGLIAPASEPAR